MRRFLIAVAILTGIGGIAASYNGLTFVPVAHASEGDGIRQVLDRWVTAFRARNIPAIMSIYAPDVVAYDMTPPLRFRGIDAYRKDYEDYFDAYDGPVDVELRDVAVVAGNDVAVAFGLERFKGKLKSGDVTDFWARFTSAFRKSTANGSTSTTTIRCRSTLPPARRRSTSSPDCICRCGCKRNPSAARTAERAALWPFGQVVFAGAPFAVPPRFG